MISGREAIKKFWSDLVHSVNAKSGCPGVSRRDAGRATLTVEPEGQSTQMEVKYVVYWRQENSLWKWHVDIWNESA
jgi:hypothetical protein